MKPPPLRRARDFEHVYAAGRRARRNGVMVVAAPRLEPGPSRVALAVRARGASAVVRNRVRRRLRAAWRQVCPPEGFDVVVRAEAQSATIPFQELVGNVGDALSAAGVRR